MPQQDRAGGGERGHDYPGHRPVRFAHLGPREVRRQARYDHTQPRAVERIEECVRAAADHFTRPGDRPGVRTTVTGDATDPAGGFVQSVRVAQSNVPHACGRSGVP